MRALRRGQSERRAAKAAFITHFKEIQRLKTQLDQYTDLTEENKAAIAQVLPEESLRGFKGEYLETAQKLREQQGKSGDKPVSPGPVDQLDFEFVLFASAIIDYDYIMALIARFSQQKPGKSKMTREQLIGLVSADAKFMNERDDIAEYIGTLKAGEGLSETAIREGYTRFKTEKDIKELAAIAGKHGLATTALQTFVDGILDRMIFDGEQLSDLMAPLDLGWKARTEAELSLMADLHPLFLNVRKRMKKEGGTIGKIYGQESNITTYNLARMNMLLHGVKDTEFEIYHGDSLKNEWDILRELNPAKKPSFDAIVANPPFSLRWEPTDPWPTTCASRAMAWPPSPPPTSPSSSTASISSRTKVSWPSSCLTACCSGAGSRNASAPSCSKTATSTP